MFNNNNVDQSNITANKVIGRDDNSTTHNHFYNRTINYKEDSILKKLLTEHELEKDKNSEYKEFSDELNTFLKVKQVANIRDLNKKLEDGNRSYLIDLAIDSKERVTKKIYKYALYKSAQDIYTHLLINIRTAFKHCVEGKIKSKKFEVFQIDEIVSDEIIKPFLNNVQGSSLCIDLDELYGILYLLTGNCYIEWD